jgi:hypothetical protein
MTGMWIGLLAFTLSLTVQVDKEFSTAKECWDWYNIEYNYSHIGTPVLTHQGKPIPEDHHFKRSWEPYPIRLFKVKNTKELIWLTCESTEKMTGNDLSGMIAPLTIILPTPT